MPSDSPHQHIKMTPWLRRWLGIMAYLVIFSYPLLHADRLYRDDIWRSFHGEMGWVSNGRPLASLVMLIVNGGPRLTDIAPLPLWLGLAAIAAALLLWRERLREFDSGYAWLAMLILVVQPFFLQNLSYRFDALPMALSLACAVVGIACALDPRDGKNAQAVFRWLLGGAGVLASLLFYQPAANVYFVLLAFHVALYVARHGHPAWSRQLSALVIGVMALLISKWVSMWLVSGDYSVKHSAMAPLTDLPMHVVEQTWRFWNFTERLFDPPTWWLVVGLAVTTVLGLFIETWKHRRITALAILALVLICLSLSGLGFLSMLADPIWRPRIMIGFGALYAGLLFYVLHRLGRSRWPWLGWPLLVAALGSSLTLAYAYGNAQRQQALFADRVSMQLIDDLATRPRAAPLVIVGTLPHTRDTRNAIAVHPLIGELIFPYLNGYYWWGYQDLYRRGLPAAFDFNDDMPLRHRFEAHCLSLMPLTHRAWYTLYRFEDTYVVAFSGNCHRAMTAMELPIDN